MNIIKDCGNDGHDGCWTQVKNLSGANYYSSYGIGSNIRVFTLADGMNISMDLNNSNGSTLGVNLDNTAIVFDVDVNGNKKPNQMGKDVFFIIVDDNRVFPAGKDDNSVNCSKTSTGTDCAAKVLREGKIDY